MGAAPAGAPGAPATRAAANGRRAQHSAPASRFVNDEMPTAGAPRPAAPSGYAGYAGAPPRRQGGVGYGRERAAPHTADGLGADHSSANGGAAGGSAASPTRNYKPYTGKVSSEYMHMGKLKPDLNAEELLAKRANRERVKLFSRNLQVINRDDHKQYMANKPEHAEDPPASAPSKAQRAREYAAKQVPKPRPRPQEVQAAVSDVGGGAHAPVSTSEDDALAELERQHAQHRAQAAAIRAELGLG